MMAAVAHVTSGEFRGTRALVVGGSRGLGEITAKLLAAGGSDVAITYSVGAQDAQTVSREIIGFGGRCLALHYDVRRDALTQLSQMNLSPTHVFYFATPHIAGNKALGFDLDRFREFEAFYLVGFYALVRACLERRPEGIQAFYPSTTFISERPGAMTEYAMVKAAGELLCADIVRFTPNVTIVSRRLPRLPTDQTGSIAQELLADPIETLLPIIREMHT
jgi:NAD(P)-dependent dehydrogenase (short-subunit alcohol dehydrogenase family)